MKAYILLLSILGLYSCQKSIDSNSSLVDKVAGEYTVTELKVNKTPLNIAGINAKVIINKMNKKEANMSLTTLINGISDKNDLGNVILSGTLTEIFLTQSNKQVGSVVGKTLSLDIVDNGDSYSLKAQK